MGRCFVELDHVEERDQTLSAGNGREFLITCAPFNVEVSRYLGTDRVLVRGWVWPTHVVAGVRGSQVEQLQWNRLEHVLEGFDLARVQFQAAQR